MASFKTFSFFSLKSAEFFSIKSLREEKEGGHEQVCSPPPPVQVGRSFRNPTASQILHRAAHMQVTSALPSSCSKPPSSRWDRALGYPPPNTGNPPMPPAVGDGPSPSSGGTGRLTARLTERLDTSPGSDDAWTDTETGVTA